MKDKSIFLLHSGVCKALANPIRLEIIEILARKELSFKEIQAEIGILKSNLSQHISVLVKNGLLKQRKIGQNVFYMLTSTKISNACQIMKEVLIDNIKKQQKLITKI